MRLRLPGIRLPLLAVAAWAGISLTVYAADLRYGETVYVSPTSATVSLALTYLVSRSYPVATDYIVPSYIPTSASYLTTSYYANPVTVLPTTYLATTTYRRGLFGRRWLVERPLFASYDVAYVPSSYVASTYVARLTFRRPSLCLPMLRLRTGSTGIGRRYGSLRAYGKPPSAAGHDLLRRGRLGRAGAGVFRFGHQQHSGRERGLQAERLRGTERSDDPLVRRSRAGRSLTPASRPCPKTRGPKRNGRRCPPRRLRTALPSPSSSQTGARLKPTLPRPHKPRAPTTQRKKRPAEPPSPRPSHRCRPHPEAARMSKTFGRSRRRQRAVTKPSSGIRSDRLIARDRGASTVVTFCSERSSPSPAAHRGSACDGGQPKQ